MKTYPLLNRLMHRFQGPETGGESGSTSGGTPTIVTPSPDDGHQGDTGRGADLRIAKDDPEPSGEGHDGGDDSGDAGVDADGEPAPRRQRTEAERMQRRMDRRTKQLGEKDREIAMLREQLGQRTPTRQPAPVPEDEGEDRDTQPTAPSREDFNRQVQSTVEQQIEAIRIAERTTKLIKSGRALDPKFDAAAANVAGQIPFVAGPEGRESATPFIKALYDCDHPEAIILHLHANPDELDDLADMTVRQRDRALLKLDIQLAQASTPRRSGAPKPLEVITGGRSGSSTNEARQTDEEWRANRLKQRNQTKR